MSEPQAQPAPGLGTVTIVASLMGLWALGVAQPLLDLIGRNAAFLVAHDATRVDVVVMAVAVTLLAPLLLAAAVLLWRAAGLAGAASLHVGLVGLLAALVAVVVLQLGGVTARVPGVLALLLAGVVGAAFAWAYMTYRPLRLMVSASAVVAPVVAVLFLFASPASGMVFPEAVDVEPVVVPDPAPIVMVMFDELPVASLVDRDGFILSEAFPNFARLAEDATFLRNVTALHGQTSDALPAILSSRYPRAESLPLAADHPRNLFTLLADQYSLHVEEPLTELCPPGRCGGSSRPARSRYPQLFADLAVVGARLVVPPDLAGRLPPLDQGWRDFRTAAAETGKEAAVADRFHEAREESPASTFEDFVGGVRRQPGPALHYIHTLLPHSPWRYLPDGTVYTDEDWPPGLEYGQWTHDPWPVAHGFQRHLLQTQLADRLLGLLLDKLHAEHIYDGALIVVTADHGASFSPGTSLRVISEETIPEIARVPLLLKAPGQSHAEINDLPLEAVDILPTMLDGIGAAVPQGVVGHSAFDPTAPARATRRFFGPHGEVVITEENADIGEVVDRNLGWLAGEGTTDYAYRLAPGGLGSLLGAEVPAQTAAAAGASWRLGGGRCETAGAGPARLPPLLCGTVDLQGAEEGTTYDVAIAVHRTVVALTRVSLDDATSGSFHALLPPEVHGRDARDLRLFLLGENRRLLEVPTRGPQG